MARYSVDGKSGKQLRKEREIRIMNAIRLKPTDRVPVISSIGYFPAKYTGIPCSAAYYDFDAWYKAYEKTLPDFQADIIYAQPFTPGKALEILEPEDDEVARPWRRPEPGASGYRNR